MLSAKIAIFANCFRFVSIMRKLQFLLWLALVLCVPVLAGAQQSISERLDLQRYEFPQEKVHVFTDRGRYLVGDTIWLRAWVVDATNHVPVNVSRFLYVDLVAPNDSVITRVKLHSSESGVFTGYVPIGINIPEGHYQLTAYTMFMQSVGESYFCRKSIDVESLASFRQRIVSRCVRHENEVDVILRYEDATNGELLPFKQMSYYLDNKQCWNDYRGKGKKEVRFTLKGKDADMPAMLVQFDNYSKFIALPQAQETRVTFHPEGGYLVPGVENAMTFKMHGSGAAHLRGGELIDAQGKAVAKLVVEHDGMGLVRFTPEFGVDYIARWTDEFEQPIDFALPKVRDDATVVQVRCDVSGMVYVRTAGNQADSALLVVQERGRLLASGYGSLLLNEDEIPAGVVQVMAFDNRWHCMSERLFFAGGGAFASTVGVKTDYPAYVARQRVRVDVDLSELTRDMTNYAVSVIDDKAAIACEGNIYANLLLQSDLRGHINHPDYYFQPTDSLDAAVRGRHLDMLLLTQGWRRYDVQRVMQGRLVEPKFPIEQSQVVTGRVLSEWRKKPVVGADVSLIAPRIAYSNKTVTDSLGEFSIAMPLLPDSVECIVMAENVKGQKQMNLMLDAESFPQLYYRLPVDSVASFANIRDEQDWRLEHSGDWRHIVLSELLVTAPHRRLTESARDAFTLNAQNIANRGINSVEGFTYALPGIMVYNGNLYTPGGQDRDRVRIVVDGEPVREDYSSEIDFLDEILHYMTPIEREKQSRIYYPSGTGFSKSYQVSEITIAESMISFKNLDYVHFTRGPRGHGGVLVIEHKKGFKGKNGEPNRYLKIIQPMGVQQPVEYYTPLYENGDNCGNAPGTDLRNVLYWNPCVDVQQSGMSHFDFYTSDTSTTYTITLEGITSSGTPFRATKSIENQAK